MTAPRLLQLLVQLVQCLQDAPFPDSDEEWSVDQTRIGSCEEALVLWHRTVRNVCCVALLIELVTFAEARGRRWSVNRGDAVVVGHVGGVVLRGRRERGEFILEAGLAPECVVSASGRSQ